MHALVQGALPAPVRERGDVVQAALAGAGEVLPPPSVRAPVLYRPQGSRSPIEPPIPVDPIHIPPTILTDAPAPRLSVYTTSIDRSVPPHGPPQARFLHRLGCPLHFVSAKERM